MRGPELLPQLRQTFGYDSFRPLQEEIMSAALDGRDTLAILPTGAGKSLCYQLPALVRDGLTLVVSPLIALMKDQVDQLEACGVAATFLNSTLDPAEAARRVAGLREGKFDLLYVAPERLMLPDFLNGLRDWNIAALAVDEAHCISEWGHDFRPEYRRIREVRQRLPELPVLALTATATARVRSDIAVQLDLRDPAIFLASFNRPNLKYQVIAKINAAAQVVSIATDHMGESGIVYCQSRKSTESLAATLRAKGFAAVAYHAGLEAVERAANQEAFLRDEAKIVCATIAFGMGINKPDVRFVIHADLPKNIEGYYQETGRAGRDGLPADCILLFSRGDTVRQSKFIDEISDPDARAVALQQLEDMAGYAEGEACRRANLLNYFGETFPHDNCGGCDHCLNPREQWDATVEVHKLLSCVLRIHQVSRIAVGFNHLAEVLVGGMSQKIRARQHDQLSTHGIGKDHARGFWIDLGRQLLRYGLLESAGDPYPVVSLTRQGTDILKRQRKVMLVRPLSAEPQSASNRNGDIPCDDGLFEQVRNLRKQLADAKSVPPYVVFSDVTLRHLCRDYPETDEALLHVPGVGEKKRDDYGGAFLKAIRNWLAGHPRLSFEPLAPPPPVERPPRTTGGSTVFETLTLWKSGMKVDAIAKARGFVASTIESHLAQAIEGGEVLDPRAFFTAEEEQIMEAAFEGYTDPALKPVYEHLEGKISYGKLRIFRAFSHNLVPN